MKVTRCLLHSCLPPFFLGTIVQRNSEFVGAAILELLKQGLIIEVNSPPHCVNPLSVAEGKKLHLVLYLREVNRYLVKCNFRYEDLRSLVEVFQKGFRVFYMGPKIRVSPTWTSSSRIDNFWVSRGQLPVLHDISVSQYYRSGLAPLAIVLRSFYAH